MEIDKAKVRLGNREIEVILCALDELGCSTEKTAYPEGKEEKKVSYLKEVEEIELYLGKILDSRGGWGEY